MCPERLTCNMSAEPLVILTHYNIPERDVSLQSIGYSVGVC